MARLIKNPISIAFISIGGGLIFYSVIATLYAIFVSTGRVREGVKSGQGVLEAIQLVLFPYTYNFARKLNQGMEDRIVLILVIMQVLIVISIFIVSKVTGRRLKLTISILGILLVISYFSYTFLAILLTGIH